MAFNQYPYINENDLNLDYILKHVKELIAGFGDLNEWRKTHEAEYQELKALYDEVMAGDFPPSIVEAFNKYMLENGLDLVGSTIKAVHFGLTNDGYFCAFIPDSWSSIQFDTITDYSEPLYGHLMLLYD